MAFCNSVLFFVFFFVFWNVIEASEQWTYSVYGFNLYLHDVHQYANKLYKVDPFFFHFILRYAYWTQYAIVFGLFLQFDLLISSFPNECDDAPRLKWKIFLIFGNRTRFWISIFSKVAATYVPKKVRGRGRNWAEKIERYIKIFSYAMRIIALFNDFNGVFNEKERVAVFPF